jgi:hypothetical protein
MEFPSGGDIESGYGFFGSDGLAFQKGNRHITGCWKASYQRLHPFAIYAKILPKFNLKGDWNATFPRGNFSYRQGPAEALL